MMAALKPRLNALATETQRPGAYRGIRLFHFDASAETAHLDDSAALADLRGEGEGAVYAFEAAGLPTTYEESEAVALIGQQPRHLSENDLRSLLKRGVFDGPAAHILCERGFGSMIGMDAVDAPQPLEKHGAISAEELLHRDFGGAPRRYLTALLPNANYKARLCRLSLAPGAVEVSRLVNPDTDSRGPSMVAFENKEGGRVIVHGWDYGTSIGAAYHGPDRTRQMQAAAVWLFRGRVPLLARGDGVWPLAYRKDCGDRTVAGLFQLSLDPWHEGILMLQDERTPATIERLDPVGVWSKQGIASTRQGQTLTLRLEGPITYGQPAVARIVWSANNV